MQDVGLMQLPDPDILAWAGAAGRILLTHDRNTMTGFAATRVKAGQPMPGLFVVDRQASSGRTLITPAGTKRTSPERQRRDPVAGAPGLGEQLRCRRHNDLEALAAASEMDEWRDPIIFVPL